MSSRANRRSGTKSNTCTRCPTGKNGKMVMKFRGRGRGRLLRHLREVHKV
jgi:hypothetical protein